MNDSGSPNLLFALSFEIKEEIIIRWRNCCSKFTQVDRVCPLLFGAQLLSGAKVHRAGEIALLRSLALWRESSRMSTARAPLINPLITRHVPNLLIP